MRRLFGTDGVRGVANVFPVTCEVALAIGRALVQVCGREGSERCKVVIGKDTRVSGDMLENALAAGVCSGGGEVVVAGVIPTPAVGYLTRSMGYDAGAVVSASHNPFQDNGIKLFARTGFKLPDAVEEEIERLVEDQTAPPPRPPAAAVGRVHRLADAPERYVSFLRDTCSPDLRLSGLRIVVDCANGAAHRVGPQLFRQLGADVALLGATPDGENINRECGAVHPRALQERVLSERAQLGIAVDGDADRAVFVDERGDLVDGDEVLAMVAAEMLARGTLRQATVVATMMSNIGLELALRDRGARLVRVQVGDRYVVEEMRQHGYNLGGEQSGHILFLDHSTTGDGLLAGLNVVRLMVEQQRPLSELKRVMSKFPQILVNVQVGRREPLEDIPAVRETIAQITSKLNNRGRVLVRYSGTEPLIRVMVEGEYPDEVQTYADEIAAVIRGNLGG